MDLFEGNTAFICTEILFEEFCLYSSIALEINGLEQKGFNSNSMTVKKKKLIKKAHHVKYTHPVVSTHGIKRIGTTYKNHLIVSWNKYFNKVVAFILKKVIIELLLDIPYVDIVGWSPRKDEVWQITYLFYLLYVCLS